MAVTENDALRNPEVSPESSDVAPLPVLFAGLALAGVTLLCALIVLGMVAWNSRSRAGEPSEVPPIARGVRAMPPEPRLQSSPRLDFEQFRAEQLRELESSGWVDREKGIAHISIAAAIRIVAQRGIPPQPTPEDLNLTTPQAGSRLTGFEGRAPQDPK